MNDSSTESGYLSKKTIGKAKIKRQILLIVGGILTVFFILSAMMAIAGVDESIRDSLMIYLVLLVPSVIILYCGIKLGTILGKANQYNAIFKCDQDGIITMTELTKQTGKASDQILLEVEDLLKRGYLCNCSLQVKGQPCVILSDGVITGDNAGFVRVICPKCGGTTKLRAGSSGICEYCGSSISGN